MNMNKISFKEWLDEDVRPQMQQFIALCRETFPKCAIHTDHAESLSGLDVEVHVSNFFGKSIAMRWYAGNIRADKRYSLVNSGLPESKDQSFLDLDFYYFLTSNTRRIGAGDNIPTEVDANSIGFARAMSEFTKKLKQIGVNILFAATSHDRADAYAKILWKAGYTLGHYNGIKQLWLANPGDKPNENPYADKQSFAQRKSIRKNQTIT